MKTQNTEAAEMLATIDYNYKVQKAAIKVFVSVKACNQARIEHEKNPYDFNHNHEINAKWEAALDAYDASEKAVKKAVHEFFALVGYKAGRFGFAYQAVDAFNEYIRECEVWHNRPRIIQDFQLSKCISRCW